LLGLLDELPPPQAAALAGAVALGPPVPGDRFTIAASALSLLSLAAGEEPVRVVVDDAQWLDPASREALLFATHRLRDEAVVVLLAVREGEGQFDWSDADTLRLQGVDVGTSGRAAAASDRSCGGTACG
jgi:hypothetical protein